MKAEKRASTARIRVRMPCGIRYERFVSFLI